MSLSTLEANIRDALPEVERKGADREEVAELLEAYADAVRNGHTDLPEDRGQWWQEVHGENTGEAPAAGD